MSESDKRKSRGGEMREKRIWSWLKRWLKRVAVLGFLLVACFFIFLWNANHAATRAGKGILFDSVDEVPHRRAGLVFGCSEKLGTRENLYFKYRIEAAAELWKAGKVDCLIVSGDNREKYYNEPVAMRKALVKAGVPFRKIACDYAGLRTLDSVVRAKKIFGLNRVTLISQKFQNERAAYIAKANGMDVVGYNAKDVKGYAARKTEDREVLARVKMWIDIHITHKQPHHLGERVLLPE
jgi:SanA protein